MVTVINQKPDIQVQPVDEAQVQALVVQSSAMTTWAQGADTMLNEMEQHLGQVYADAEAAGDQATMQRIGESWERAQSLKAQAQNAVAAFISAVAVLEPTAAQRDQVVLELASLEKAIKSWDSEHPLVGGLIDGVRDEARFEVEESLGEYYGEITYENLYYGAMENLGLPSDAASDLVSAIWDDFAPDVDQLDRIIAALTARRDEIAADAGEDADS